MLCGVVTMTEGTQKTKKFLLMLVEEEGEGGEEEEEDCICALPFTHK